MNKERLNRLISRLEKVKPDHFEVSSWYDPRSHGWNSFEKTEILLKAPGLGEDRNVILKEGFCGSTACILGHAAMIKEFQEEGLFLYYSREHEIAGIVLKTDGVLSFGADAGAKFFDIPEKHAEALFYVAGSNLLARVFVTETDKWGYPMDPSLDEAIATLKRYVATDGRSVEDAIEEEEDYY